MVKKKKREREREREKERKSCNPVGNRCNPDIGATLGEKGRGRKLGGSLAWQDRTEGVGANRSIKLNGETFFSRGGRWCKSSLMGRVNWSRVCPWGLVDLSRQRIPCSSSSSSRLFQEKKRSVEKRERTWRSFAWDRVRAICISDRRASICILQFG